MQGLLSDPWVRAQIDAAVAPYVGRLGADEIGWMRERLAEALATESGASELVRRARPRPAVERSGEVRCEPPAEGEGTSEPPVRRDGTG